VQTRGEPIARAGLLLNRRGMRRGGGTPGGSAVHSLHGQPRRREDSGEPDGVEASVPARVRSGKRRQKLEGGWLVEAPAAVARGRTLEGTRSPGEHRADGRLHRTPSRNGLVPGSKALKPHRRRSSRPASLQRPVWDRETHGFGAGEPPRSCLRARSSDLRRDRGDGERQEGTDPAERRGGSGRGKSSGGCRNSKSATA
jgi:hypothetical protein